MPAVHSLSMQSTEKELNETAVVDQLFLTMKVSRDHATRFVVFNI